VQSSQDPADDVPRRAVEAAYFAHLSFCWPLFPSASTPDIKSPALYQIERGFYNNCRIEMLSRGFFFSQDIALAANSLDEALRGGIFEFAAEITDVDLDDV